MHPLTSSIYKFSPNIVSVRMKTQRYFQLWKWSASIYFCWILIISKWDELSWEIILINDFLFKVSMRILEVTLCTLLAVIATTPLRSEFDIGARMAAENGGTMMMDGGLSYHGDMMIDPGSHGNNPFNFDLSWPASWAPGLWNLSDFNNYISLIRQSRSQFLDCHLFAHPASSFIIFDLKNVSQFSLSGHYGRHEIPAAQTSGNCFTRIFCCWRQKSGNLRSGRREKSSCGNSSLCCTLCTDSNPPREFEDEIYSEIWWA